jgi:hypothetical protein
MALVLILRPTGLTGGREFTFRQRRPGRLLDKVRKVTDPKLEQLKQRLAESQT